MRNFRNQRRRGRGRPKASTRNAEIVRLFTETPVTLKELGDRYGVSRERIRQILKRQGVENIDGARHSALVADKVAQEKERAARWNARTARIYGCSLEEALTLNGGALLNEHGTLSRYYRNRRDNVTRFEGPDQWQMTLPEWAALWAGKRLGSRHGPKSWVATRRDRALPWTRDNVMLIRRDECTSRTTSAYHAKLRSSP